MPVSAKRDVSAPVEEIMEFVEEPLSYEEARRGIAKFERVYKTTSAALFCGHCEPDVRVSSDALFEWKSYYDFVCQVDRRIAAALAASHMDSVSYSKSSGETQPRSPEQRRQASLCIAA